MSREGMSGEMPRFLVDGICHHSGILAGQSAFDSRFKAAEGMITRDRRNFSGFDFTFERKVDDLIRIEWERKAVCNLAMKFAASKEFQISGSIFRKHLQSQLRPHSGRVSLGDDQWALHLLPPSSCYWGGRSRRYSLLSAFLVTQAIERRAPPTRAGEAFVEGEGT